MPTGSRTLSLICRAKSIKGESALRKKLSQAGYDVKPVVVTDPSVLTTDWVSSHISGQSKGLLFIDEDLDYVREISEKLRPLPTGMRFLPIFYGYTTSKRLSDLESASNLPISDFFA